MARSAFKVLFYLERQAEGNGKVPVMGRITVNGTISQFNCRLSVFPKLRDPEANKASDKSVAARCVNEKLENIRTSSGKQYQRVGERDAYGTAEKIENAWLGFGGGCRLLSQTFDVYLKEFAPVWDGRSYLMDRSALSDFAGYEDMFRPDTIVVGSLPVPGQEGKFDKFYVVQWGLHRDSLYLQAVDYDRRVAQTIKNRDVLCRLIEELTGRTFDASGRIFADWVNGCYFVKLPDTPPFPQEMPPLKTGSNHWPMRRHVELTFRNGRLVSRKTFDPATGRTTNDVGAPNRSADSSLENRIP